MSSDDESRSVNGPMVQVGWFSHGVHITMRDMAMLRGTRIRADAVPFYADAADARCFHGVEVPWYREPIVWFAICMAIAAVLNCVALVIQTFYVHD